MKGNRSVAEIKGAFMVGHFDHSKLKGFFFSLFLCPEIIFLEVLLIKPNSRRGVAYFISLYYIVLSVHSSRTLTLSNIKFDCRVFNNIVLGVFYLQV